jgi:hypothetical protein
MAQRDLPGRRTDQPTLKVCPWCGGGLNFTASYPVTRLAPGESRRLREEDIPALLRTVPAWTCATPHCKYREPA